MRTRGEGTDARALARELLIRCGWQFPPNHGPIRGYVTDAEAQQVYDAVAAALQDARPPADDELREAARRHCEALRAIPYDEFAAEERCHEVEQLLAARPPQAQCPCGHAIPCCTVDHMAARPPQAPAPTPKGFGSDNAVAENPAFMTRKAASRVCPTCGIFSDRVPDAGVSDEEDLVPKLGFQLGGPEIHVPKRVNVGGVSDEELAAPLFRYCYAETCGNTDQCGFHEAFNEGVRRGVRALRERTR